MQPAMKVNYFNHDFSTSSEWSDCHDRQLGTNVIIDHTLYHAVADDNWLVVLQLEMLLSDNSFSRSHTISLLAKMRSTLPLRSYF